MKRLWQTTRRLWLALAASVLFANVAHAALATCGSGTTALSSGSTQLFGNAFISPQSFSDCYSFSLPTTSNAFGGTLTIDPLSLLDINISSVALSGAGLSTSLIDFTPGIFSFSGLLPGAYQLIVSGTVTRGRGGDDALPLPVGYAGSLTANGIPPSAPAVPEPSTWIMIIAGFAGIGFMAYVRPSRRTNAVL